MPILPRHIVIQDAVDANDPVRLQQIRQSIHNSISNSPIGSSPSRSTFSNSHSHSHGHGPSAPFGLPSMSFPTTHGSLSNGQRFNGSPSVTLAFKSSPFYQIEARAGDVKVCDGRSCAFFPNFGQYANVMSSHGTTPQHGNLSHQTGRPSLSTEVC